MCRSKHVVVWCLWWVWCLQRGIRLPHTGVCGVPHDRPATLPLPTWSRGLYNHIRSCFQSRVTLGHDCCVSVTSPQTFSASYIWDFWAPKITLCIESVLFHRCTRVCMILDHLRHRSGRHGTDSFCAAPLLPLVGVLFWPTRNHLDSRCVDWGMGVYVTCM